MSSSTSSLFNAKKSFQIKRWRSMCDLECSAYLPIQHEEDFCGLSVYYNEAMPRLLTDDDELPPPQYYHLSQSQDSPSKPPQRVPAKMNLPTAVLSMVKPHKILSISTELCDFLGFGAEEMMGRSLNLLHGPKTMPRL